MARPKTRWTLEDRRKVIADKDVTPEQMADELSKSPRAVKRRAAANEHDKLALVAEIRRVWLSGTSSVRELSRRYGFRVDSIVYNKSYYDPAYNPSPKGTTRPRG